jgi:hypothetical protein
MNKSFKNRLAALEALEAAAEAEQHPTGQVFNETDADAHDDELLAEAASGLTNYATFANIRSFSSGKLSPARYWSEYGCPEQRYWTRICEHAAALCREQGIVIFPIVREDAIAALELVDTGVMTCRPFYERCWKSHNTTSRFPAMAGLRAKPTRFRAGLPMRLIRCTTKPARPSSPTLPSCPLCWRGH